MGRKEELRKLEKTESVCLKKLNRDLPPGPVRGGGGGARIVHLRSRPSIIHFWYSVSRPLSAPALEHQKLQAAKFQCYFQSV